MMKLLGLSFELILAYWRWSLPQVPILEKVARNACEIHKNKLVDDKKNNLLFPDFLSAIQPETDGQGGSSSRDQSLFVPLLSEKNGWSPQFYRTIPIYQSLISTYSSGWNLCLSSIMSEMSRPLGVD